MKNNYKKNKILLIYYDFLEKYLRKIWKIYSQFIILLLIVNRIGCFFI